LAQQRESADAGIERTGAQWWALGFLALAELLAMTLWFSASAVVPTLKEEWGVSSAAAAWLTMSVQIGFVAGTFLSEFLNLPDIVNTRRLFAISAVLGAGSNAAFALFASGLAVGLLVGALMVGSGFPHLVRAVGDMPWDRVVLISSVFAIIGAGIVLGLVRDGPFGAEPARFNPRLAVRCLLQPGVRLTNVGYLGHMLELYAMWP
jgi:hypothetical protein